MRAPSRCVPACPLSVCLLSVRSPHHHFSPAPRSPHSLDAEPPPSPGQGWKVSRASRASQTRRSCLVGPAEFELGAHTPRAAEPWPSGRPILPRVLCPPAAGPRRPAPAAVEGPAQPAGCAPSRLARPGPSARRSAKPGSLEPLPARRTRPLTPAAPCNPLLRVFRAAAQEAGQWAPPPLDPSRDQVGDEGGSGRKASGERRVTPAAAGPLPAPQF